MINKVSVVIIDFVRYIHKSIFIPSSACFLEQRGFRNLKFFFCLLTLMEWLSSSAFENYLKFIRIVIELIFLGIVDKRFNF